ncbi:MAG: helix-turn-helix domain-containing protein [Clostridia bacterium]|nr:helix-turn-helix domain-containing protein [Clostridia bacterium]
MTTSQRIVELRMRAGMSQEELASRLFVGRSLVSKWENGSRRPSREQVTRMAAVFGVEPDSILSYDRAVLAELSRSLPRNTDVPPERLPELIDEFLGQLGDNEREVFIRRYHFLEDQRMIAERLGLTYGAVRTTLFRTRKKLKSFLTGRI